MWAYALPLIPLGVISWASTLGDRYFIGGLLGVADAGIYAAGAWRSSNSPFMILNMTAELWPEAGLSNPRSRRATRSDRVES